MLRSSLILLAVALAPFTQAEAAVLTVDCVAGPFVSISGAVAAASNGDTIVVHECAIGPYIDNVVIAGFDDLHIVGAESGTGNVGVNSIGATTLHTPPAVITSSGIGGPCFSIQGSSDVSIANLHIRSCDNGIEVFQSQNTVVTSNRIDGHAFAGYFEAAGENNLLAGNLIGQSEFGVYIEVTDGLRIVDNRIGLNSANGMLLAGRRLHVVNNESMGNGSEGIRVLFGGEQRIERNRAMGNGGAANIIIEAGVPGVDVIGNASAGSIIDMSASDLAENL